MQDLVSFDIFKKNIDSTWTLFLDRDGVLNHEKKGDYIRNRNEFYFYDGIKNALGQLAPVFNKIVIVTNQRGVGRGWMTVEDLLDIHSYMVQEMHNANGRIDGIYYCTDVNSDSPNRKPNPGMALQAKQDFPTINFSTSIMVGNKMSDMLFGKAAGMHTIFVATTNPETEYPHEAIDFRFNSLPSFADALLTNVS